MTRCPRKITRFDYSVHTKNRWYIATRGDDAAIIDLRDGSFEPMPYWDKPGLHQTYPHRTLAGLSSVEQNWIASLKKKSS